MLLLTVVVPALLLPGAWVTEEGAGLELRMLLNVQVMVVVCDDDHDDGARARARACVMVCGVVAVVVGDNNDGGGCWSMCR